MLTKKKSILYDASQVDKGNLLFTNKALKTLLIPLMIEQLLNTFMGMADTMMVSNVGSSAISAVSLVDSINILVTQVFSAMAVGATIICSQYLGKGDIKKSNEAARQIFLSILAISLLLMGVFLGFREQIFKITFGKVEADVMANAMTYFLITVLSYPFLALFNVGSAFYRAGGNSKLPMKISILSNMMNVVGNIFFIAVLQMGVAGVAIATLLSRVFGTVVIFWLLHKPNQPIVLNHYLKIRPNMKVIGMILAIGLPTGIENGMFQFGKLAIQSTVSELGTQSIAAQAMTNMLEMLNGIVAIGIGIGLMTVVGQCMGTGRKEEAKYYIIKLTAYAEVAMIISCMSVFVLTKPVIWLGGMERESAILCFQMMTLITLVKPMVWVLSFIPAYGMRAAGDVKFSMIASTLTMWICRVALCIYLVKVWGFGILAVWIGMFVDWTVRAVIFTVRFLSGRWCKKVI